MLSETQQRAVVEEGYVRLPGAVPRVLVERARRAINASLGSRGLPPDELRTFAARSYCPELREDPVITDLFNASELRPGAESLLGRLKPVGRGQIALRFPRLDAERSPVRGHIDGIATPTNGVPPGTLAHFTMLVGVLLSDVPDEWSGNFTAFPGSHHRFHRWLQEHEVREMADGLPDVDPGPARQVTGRAGDAFFAHYLLCHGIAPNLSPNIRYAVFFRVNHADQVGFRPEAVRDMWLDWEGLHPRLGRSAAGVR